ncbi:MAG: methylamine utilization protein MauJ [Acholeplasmatales bacterium]
MNWIEFKTTIDKIVKFIRIVRSESFFTDIIIDDDSIRFNNYEALITYNKIEFENDIEKMSTDDNELYFEVYDDNSLEIMINTFRNPLYSRSYDVIENTVIKDESNQLIYKIESPSKLMILEIVKVINKNNNMLKRIFKPIMIAPTKRNVNILNTSDEKTLEVTSLFELLSLFLRNEYSLTIHSIYNRGKSVLEKLLNSFMFTLSYNLDISIKPLIKTEDVFKNRNKRGRYNYLKDISAPKLLYNQQLIEQYNMALESNDSFIEFIAYYRIIEYFYEDAYNEKLVNDIKEKISSPKFSYKSTKHISEIITLVEKQHQPNKRGFKGDELRALQYTLEKFINFEELKKEIGEINSDLLIYYKNNKVKFSNGDIIDFSDQIKISNKMANRVYLTRNSLVHNKSNDYLTMTKERQTYSPFKDDYILAK